MYMITKWWLQGLNLFILRLVYLLTAKILANNQKHEKLLPISHKIEKTQKFWTFNMLFSYKKASGLSKNRA